PVHNVTRGSRNARFELPILQRRGLGSAGERVVHAHWSHPAQPGHDLLRNNRNRAVVGQHDVRYPDALTARYLPGRLPQLLRRSVVTSAARRCSISGSGTDRRTTRSGTPTASRIPRNSSWLETK